MRLTVIFIEILGINSTANTDNKGYKTCHGFCKPLLLSRKHSIRGHHRDGAAALNKTRVRGQVTCSHVALYRDTRKTQKTCNWTAKTAPCFAHSGLTTLSFLPGLYFPAFSRSATLTTFIAGPLGNIFYKN